jgi:hypothetical protein
MALQALSLVARRALSRSVPIRAAPRPASPRQRPHLGQRLHLGVEMLRRFVEISKQGWAQSAFHIEVRRAIPTTAVLIGAHPIEAVLMTRERRRGEDQREATLRPRNVRDDPINHRVAAAQSVGGHDCLVSVELTALCPNGPPSGALVARRASA